jgi:hypothetical protein
VIRSALVVLLVSAAFVGRVRAADAAARARGLYQKGVAAYEKRDYERAVEALRAAHELDPRPQTLFAWAQAERLSGDCPSAMVLYRQFLDGEPTEVQAEAARQALLRCERSLASRPVEEPEPAVPPPVAPVEPRAITAAPPPKAAPAPAPRAGRRFYQDPLGDALVGGGLVAATVGVVLLATGESPDGATTYGEFAERRDRRLNRQRAGAVALGVGAALVAGGVIRWALWAGEGEAGVSLAGRF